MFRTRLSWMWLFVVGECRRRSSVVLYGPSFVQHPNWFNEIWTWPHGSVKCFDLPHQPCSAALSLYWRQKRLHRDQMSFIVTSGWHCEDCYSSWLRSRGNFVYLFYLKNAKHIPLNYNKSSTVIKTKIPVWFQESIAGHTECHLHRPNMNIISSS